MKHIDIEPYSTNLLSATDRDGQVRYAAMTDKNGSTLRIIDLQFPTVAADLLDATNSDSEMIE
jgi:hypothetical protein